MKGPRKTFILAKHRLLIALRRPEDTRIGELVSRHLIRRMPFRLARIMYWERVLPQRSNIPYNCYIQPTFCDVGDGYALGYDIRKKDDDSICDQGVIDLWPTYWGYCTARQMRRLGFEEV